MSDYDLPKDLRYSEDDEWARDEESRVVIGVTDFAQQQLGDIVFLELPEPGTEIRKGEPFGTIESVKAVSDLFAPISGEVLEVNEALVEKPEMVNDAPYGDGWIIAVEASDPSELTGLLDADGYAASVAEREG